MCVWTCFCVAALVVDRNLNKFCMSLIQLDMWPVLACNKCADLLFQ